VLDVISTNQALAKGNVELNPIIRKLMDVFGKAWWVPKLIVAAVGVVYAVPMLPVATATVIIIALNVFYGYFVYNNFQLK
jgi:hypothetical protein